MRLSFIARRNLTRHMGTTIRNVIAIGIASCVIYIFLSFIGGMENDLKHNVTTYLAGDIVVQNIEYKKNEVFNPSYFVIPEADRVMSELATLEFVEAISPKLYIPVTMSYNELFEPLQVVGLDFEREQRYNSFQDFIIEGRLPQSGNREIIIGDKTAQRFNFKVGDSVTFIGSTVLRGQNGMSGRVVGIFKYPIPILNERKIIMSLADAQYFFRSPDMSTNIDMKISDTANSKEAISEVSNKIAALGLDTELLVDPWNNVSDLYQLLVSSRFLYFIIGAIFCILGNLVIYNSIYLSLYSRRYELGVLNAMGFTNKMLRKVFRYEVLYTIFLGAVLALILGNLFVVVVGTTGWDLSKSGDLDESTLFSIILYPSLSIGMNSILFVYTSIFGIVVGMVPIRLLRKETALSLLKSI